MSFTIALVGTSTTITLNLAIKGAGLRRLIGLLYVAVRLAHRPKLLSELKGPALSVLLALALRADNDDGSCFPGIDTIARDSGYGRSSVCNALNQLEALGLVRRTRRQRQSTLYTLEVYDSAAPDDSSQPAQSTKSGLQDSPPVPQALPASKPSTGKSAPSASIKGATRPKSGRQDAQSSDSGQEQVVVNKHTINPDSIQQPIVSVHQVDFEEWITVIEKLEKAGIDDRVAQELIAIQQKNGRKPVFVEGWLAAYREGLRTERVQGPGWLVAALRNNWSLPKAFRDGRGPRDDVERTYITGEYADIVMH